MIEAALLIRLKFAFAGPVSNGPRATRANENIPTRRHRVQTTPQQQSIGSSFFHLFSSRTMQFGDQSGNVCEHTVEGRSSRKIITHKSCRQQEGQPSSFLQRVELRRLDAQGRVKLSEVRTYDVTLQQGTPYRQLVQRDDRPVARHRGEKGAGKAGQEYRRPTARDRTGASQVPVRILGGARIGSGTPGTSCRMLRVSSCRRRWAGWPRQLHHRGNAAQGIPDPIRHRQGVSLSQRQILAWTNKTARS